MYIVLKNYKYSKSLFLNTLRYNNLLIKTNINKIMFFFNTRLARILFYFIFVEVRAFTLVQFKKLLYLFYHFILQYTQYQMFYFFFNFI